MRYAPELDGIRAVALAMVLAFHAKVPGFGAGFFGVDVFFVLSGYLITRILVAERERTGTINLTRFYVRRLARLWPAMLAMMALFLMIAPFVFTTYPMTDHLRDAAMSAIYMADYARTLGMAPAVLDHMWSLAVEEHFYLVWPLALLALVKLPRPYAIATLAVLYCAGTLWRQWSAGALGDDFWRVYHRFDTHSTGLFLGCLIGYVRLRVPSGMAWIAAFGFWLAFNYYGHQMPSTTSSGFTAAELFAALLILAQPAWLGTAPLAWLGRMSYGAYLWHYPIMHYARIEKWQWEAVMMIGTLGGIGMAVLSYYTIEAVYRRRRSLAEKGQRDVIEVPVHVRA